MKRYYLIVLLILLPIVGYGYGNNIALEIISPKEATTGTPAIPATHRIFRAYTGLTYEIRAQVIGGAYPYTFALSNTPAGMTINEHTGVITWTDPQASASNIGLRVYDRDGDYVDSTWSITVGTSGFYFIDDSAGTGGTGTAGSPFDAIDDVLALNDETGIVYFRTGTYAVPEYHPSYINAEISAVGCNLIYGNTPRIWLEYPGETATISMTNRFFEIGATTTPWWFDNLTFYNSGEWTFRSGSNQNYTTFYECEWNTISSTATGNGNQGGYFTYANGTGKYLVFQDCVFHDYTGTAGIGSLYQQDKMLIEGCSFFNQYDGSTGICTAIAAKVAISNSTIRGNEAVVSAGSVLGTGVNGMLADAGYGPSVNNEVCFNNFRHTSGSHVHWFNNNGDQQSMYYYRNTCVGRLLFRSLTGDCGPFVLENNIIVNSAYGDYEYYGDDPGPDVTAYITDTNNVKSASGIVDASGLLVNRSYVGTYGWEIADSEYYGGGTPDPDTTIINSGIRGGGGVR